MLVSPAAQSHFKSDVTRKSPKSYHRRAVSCLAVASHHQHYNHTSYHIPNGRFDAIEMVEGSASPVQTRHAKRKSEGAISLERLQKGLNDAGAASANASKDKKDAVPALLSGKLVKLTVPSGASAPRRSLLSDLLNSQGTPSRMEQIANRRRMLKSMRRYSVDASETDFSLGRPSTRVTPMQSIPSEEESPMLVDGRQGFSATPTVRYLRNPCHATIKTKLQPSAYRTLACRINDDDEETPDYFGAEDRVW
ncbi:hypothetical protein BGX21_008266 [Mortierella sp. AD011]|nr:hypothetical protein BGX20_008350 [Mortierella sp. AD010]KAF9398008.1 hypothetical protein BGX21_008266 [Mortierella sp. AD011]